MSAHSFSFPPIGQSFIILPTVDSTNNYAMALARQDKTRHGDLYFAREQTAGRGQRDRRWTSAPGDNLTISIVLEPLTLPAGSLFSLSVAVSLACYDLLKIFCGEDDLRIKWPNDLYWQDRKAGGMLIENIFRGSVWAFSIVGIGLNINQGHFGDLGKKAVSLLQITGKRQEPLELAQTLASLLQKRWEDLLAGLKTDQLDSYNRQLYKAGEWVRCRINGEPLEARVRKASEAGRLELEKVTGEIIQVQSGEMEWTT